MQKLTEAQKNAVALLRQGNIVTDDGMERELFLLLSGLVPLPNVDLLIVNDQGQLLLERRKDCWFQESWHIPGGCMHYGESFSHCVQQTALREIGTEVLFEEEPITVRNIIRGVAENTPFPRERGHNVAILFRCRLPEGFEVDNQGKNQSDDGFLQWFDRLPTDFMEIQHGYDDILVQWIEKETVQ